MFDGAAYHRNIFIRKVLEDSKVPTVIAKAYSP
jgi:hypothetical protein